MSAKSSPELQRQLATAGYQRDLRSIQRHPGHPDGRLPYNETGMANHRATMVIREGYDSLVSTCPLYLPFGLSSRN